MATSHTHDANAQLESGRYVMEQYDLQGSTATMITDAENANAWIQSNKTIANEP